jgi:uncharacterized membrane protein YgcG
MRAIFAAWLGLALLFLAPFASADERILSYDSDIKVNADGSLDVTETIVVRAEGSQINRGIYRDFPTRYEDRYGNNVVVDFDMKAVERNGKPEPWFIENLLNGVRINTGNDDFIERPAVHTFTIRYRTTRQIGFFADHDELYWNAIGTDWAFPIDVGSVKVRLPSAVPVDRMRAEGYTGPQGAKGTAYLAETPVPGVARWQLTAPLKPQEGFTIVLSFPKRLVVAPTSSQRIRWFLKDNRGVLIALAGLAVLLLFCIRRWQRIGRDPPKGVVIARYEPPQGRTPAELRYLRRRGYDTRCFSADVLDMAVAGFLRIERKDRWLVKDDWTLERTSASDETPLADTQRMLLTRLFLANKTRLALDKSNAGKLERARNEHASALAARFHPTHFKRNGGSIALAVLIAAVASALAFFLSGGGGILAIIGICALMVVVLIVFALLVRTYTPEGRQLVDEAEGFRLYLSVAERDELKSMAGPDASPVLDAKRYEKLLPYAVALDVEDAWTEKFTAVAGAAAAAEATSNIGWYSGGNIGSLGSLSHAVGSSLSSSIASASTPPGSSSGGGGGGSSGGGGGGGGGGGR